MSRNLPHRPRQRGVTLIEILVVVAIIGLIMGAIGLNVHSAWVRARVEIAEQGVKRTAEQVGMYELARRECPRSQQDLVTAGILDQPSKDPWRELYGFSCPGEHRDVDAWSKGPDRERDTQDDIRNWE